MYSYHPEDCYTCPHCSAGFTNLFGLQMHLKRCQLNREDV